MSRTPPYLAARSGMTTERLFSRRQDRMEYGSLGWRLLIIGRYPTFEGYIDPIVSMYGIFSYIYHKNQPNVGRYAIHGSYGDVDGYLQAKADMELMLLLSWNDQELDGHMDHHDSCHDMLTVDDAVADDNDQEDYMQVTNYHTFNAVANFFCQGGDGLIRGQSWKIWEAAFSHMFPSFSLW